MKCVHKMRARNSRTNMLTDGQRTLIINIEATNKDRLDLTERMIQYGRMQ